MDYDVVVVGGGAAGFFAAIQAAEAAPGLRIAILEKTGKLLQKVKISGGGRCNVTHACFSIADMAKRYPRGQAFLKKAFHEFFTTNTVAWFAARGVPLHTEADGRMFPTTNSSQTIINCLQSAVQRAGIKVLLHHGVAHFAPQQQGWQLHTTAATVLTTHTLCIASGGFPSLHQFQWLTQSTQHTIAPPVPSLFTFNLPGHPICALMGVVAPQAQVKIAGFDATTSGALLITHWGLSGPAVLRLSAFAARWLAQQQYSYTAIVNWIPSFNQTSLRQHIIQQRQAHGNLKVINTTWFGLPQRLWCFLVAQAGIAEATRWADLPAPQQNKLIQNLCHYELHAQGKTTYKDEFVTAGGIALAEVDAHTMQSRLHPNLFFAGEILDVDGITGGYNFQNAWTTGFIAGRSAALACSKPSVSA
ncbi:MAG: NAD(P)/FAD-dependent oxidoreductase [Bacteroidetes bacterium]|nr:MAG: NAD(P)/FAD-dependent oxidoreductase [Bacteroidota bacterium]